MRGIFRTTDFLIIESCCFENLQKGDVIAFRRKDNENNLVVHRIIRVTNSHCLTKGDNNRRPDIHPVSEPNLIGKVIAFERQGKTYRVRGGVAGLIGAKMVYVFRRACYLLMFRVRKFWPIRKINDIVFVFWKPRIQKIKFATPEGPVIKWIYRDRTIATWLPEKKLLKTSFLSRFLINPKNLN